MGLPSYLCAAGAVAVGLYLVRRWRVRQWGRCTSQRDMTGKVVLVTGANSGLGLESTRLLAERGAAVVMACRDMKKAEEALQKIRRHTQNGQLIPMELDLADFDSIKSFARHFKEQFSRLDVLMNNAGVVYPVEAHKRTAQNYEIHFGVNHLGHFMLTGLLLDRLQTGTSSRIVIVASGLYKNGRFDLAHIANGDNLKQEGYLNPAYANSKLCNVLFGRRLARLLEGSGVHVYSCCPGWVYTGLSRHSRLSWLKMIPALPIMFLFMRTVGQGVQTQLNCAISEDLEKESGHMYVDCKRAQYAPVAQDERAMDSLWDLSAQLTGVRFHTTELERAQSED
ncbi:Retinol dehydrogenase 12 [Amphibalanus amphitrite]|uniref:Retinol dehydrogenase 12 n=2 Tax=Amphibalanus amphitrite TaxID=1232801 RepID=A0A6A4WUB9_AMPAM|nr:retinol dehydrogenase 12-like isoform X1 [Amphibalanus amphitrite]XP_043191286.1 retinol dehydrogenase 12-like isoform X1 [Amphibalanus amphitrite]XP_043236257.1 retinol dehydrogenase 12-like isoform X1 [Amphibalanus amphitrite]XP_043236258.1 retinol dehydrogenase 12-like isoform X1 [Amphibalanus amphitrite]KAF0306222.1 Retinol dehydrogenase 12 [Amphibalanus amphitrite]KAF0306223.1 Retinol dehydrogenase 12 [Amphibalanus amphitrite]